MPFATQIFKEAKGSIRSLMEVINGGAKTTRDNNILRLSFSDIHTYLDFLEIIHARYEDISSQYLANMREQQKGHVGKTGSWAMSPEEIRLMEAGRFLYIQLRLEIESFYLFAHILLNKATNFPQVYFAHSFRREIECGSHERFWKSIQKGKQFHKLKPEFIIDINWLTKRVVHYRDKVITHTLHNEQQKRMLIRGMSFSNEGGKHKMTTGVLYPERENCEQADSETLEDLVPKINNYVCSYIAFLLAERDKSVLSESRSLS